MSSILGTTALGDPSVSAPDPASVSGGIVPAASQAASAVSQPSQPQAPSQPTPAPAQGGSRLARIIQAVAKVADTGLAGVPDKGRPSFVTGLGEGARAEQANIANQQAIKFQSFQDQVRLAQLHAQDQKLQLDTQAQTDAHVKAELDNRALANELGIKYDTIASDGDTVMGHLEAQTAAKGSASVPAGTHLSGDGETVNIPQNTQQTQDGQKQLYSMLAPAYGLPPIPPGAQFVPPNLMNMLTNKIHGYEATGPRAGQTPSHDDLPGKIGALQIQRDQLAKDGNTSPQALKALDNTLAIYKANLNALDEHAESVRKQQKQNDLDVANDPDNQSPQQKATLQHTQLENQQIAQNIKNNQPNGGASADDFGNPITPRPGGAKVANQTANSFKKNADNLAQTEQTYQQFQSVLNDINSGKDITGAQSVVSLFNAIGLSAEPLKGKGFRINNNTVEEHANATGLDQKAVKSFASLQNGEVVTPQQIKDYANIALDTRKNAYITNYNEARAMGINPSFLLPKGNGQKIDPSTASIFLHLAGGDPTKARTAAQKSGWGF